MIPTAQEFLKQRNVVGDMLPLLALHLQDFAKLHVEAALKEASENAYTEADYENMVLPYKVNKNSILKSYPVTNIK